MGDLGSDIPALESSSHEHQHHEHHSQHQHSVQVHHNQNNPPPPPPNHLHDNSQHHSHTHLMNYHHSHNTQHHGHHFPDENINFTTDIFSQSHAHNPTSTHSHNHSQTNLTTKDDSWDNTAVSQVISTVETELNLENDREYGIARAAAVRMSDLYQERVSQLNNRIGQMQHMLNASQFRRDMGYIVDPMQMMQAQNQASGSHGPALPPTGPTTIEGLKSEPGSKRKINVASSDGAQGSTSSKKSRGGAASRWTVAQDEALKSAVDKFEGRNWKAIAELVPGRDHVQCLQRWKKVLRPGLVKGHWSTEEDALLLQLIQDEKMHSWAMVASKIKGRTAKQCRERWSLNLDPGINRSPWTPEEDQLLLKLYEKMGGKWSEIKSEFNGRTENAVKTRYKSLVRAKAREWTQEQDRKLIGLRMKYGKNWAAIKKELPGRSRNAIKVRCKTLEYDNNASV